MVEKRVYALLRDNGYVFDELQFIHVKELGSRKKIECFMGIKDDKYFALFFSVAKSRVLKGEFDKLEVLVAKMSSLKDVKIEDKFYFYGAPICSKALKYAQDLGWRVIHVPL